MNFIWKLQMNKSVGGKIGRVMKVGSEFLMA